MGVIRICFMLLALAVAPARSEAQSLLQTPAQTAETRFFSVLEDIPLMPGLVELAEEAMVFDKPEGRVVEAAAITEEKNTNKIKGFYQTILPQLGWVSAGDGIFRRGDETLEIDVSSQEALSLLKVRVFPR